MYYLHYYEDESGFTQEYWSDAYIEPWLSLTEENDDVNYNKNFDGYLRIEALSSGSIAWSSNSGTGETFSRTIEYCKNGGSWIEISSYPTSYIPVVQGDVVYLRGNNESYGNVLNWDSESLLNGNTDGVQFCTFRSSTCDFNLSGNIMSLIYGDDFEGQDVLSGSCNFLYMFSTSGLKSVEGLVLPAKNVPGCAYGRMFWGADFTTAPELPAMEIDYAGYYQMFHACKYLTTAPELPITNLHTYCYIGMFQGCTRLVNPPELPVTTLEEGCYHAMFADCTSLTHAPELPATTMANWCYRKMFMNCTSLTSTPELPATTLASYCYQQMFYGCTGISTTQEVLPATWLPSGCYHSMFMGCTSLTTAPEIPIIDRVEQVFSLENMFRNSSVNYVKCLIRGRLSGLNFAMNWLLNVAQTGTFVRHPDFDWPRYEPGNEYTYHGIPEGWTIVDYTP